MCSGVSAVRRSCPASSRSTRCEGSSLRRAASVAPAEPPPMIMVSYSCSIMPGHLHRLRGLYHPESGGLSRKRWWEEGFAGMGALHEQRIVREDLAGYPQNSRLAAAVARSWGGAISRDKSPPLWRDPESVPCGRSEGDI